tara:strand:+ start:184 stop:354 length:171 start_codon:yes stop_codon:yes gene_type:complete
LKFTKKNEFPTINICYKVPAENASEIKEVLKAHVGYMKVSYIPDNPLMPILLTLRN